MQTYRYSGIPVELAEEARRTRRSPQYGHPAHRERASGTGPCRLCLRTFTIGEEDRLLFTYQPFSEEGSLPAPGPVFIHPEPCERFSARTLPPDFRRLPLVIEGFRRGGNLATQVRVLGEDAEAVVARVFDEPGVEYAHIRNGEAGCFMARIDRDTDGAWPLTTVEGA
jgi:hypothetical protein